MVPKIKAEERINDYLNQNEAAKRHTRDKVYLQGGYQEFEVYKFRTEDLVFNLENTRFEVQKLRDEKENGPINPRIPEGKDRIINLLLYQRGVLRTSAKKLMTSLKKNGQLRPGTITYDGAVLNGNRRLACLIYMNRIKPGGKFAYFEATRLPKGTNEKDHFEVEAENQWADELKEDYDSLNKYMMLKRAIETFSMSSSAIAHMKRQKEQDVKKDIAELELIEEYLLTTDDPEDFVQIDGQTEIFGEMAKAVERFKRLGSKARVISDYKKHIFHLIKINQSNPNTTKYSDIRKINKAYARENKHIINQYKKTEKITEPEKIKEILETGAERSTILSNKEKPEHFADTIYENAKKLKKESRRQSFSKGCENTIRNSIVILDRLLKR